MSRWFLSTAAIILAISALATARDVPQWQPADFAFEGGVHENPFTVDFRAAVTRPDGRTFESLGFYDGENTWKVRISADQMGEWSLRTISEDERLNGRAEKFTCVANANPRVRGALNVDASHPDSFIWEDGTRFFLMGYECDWLWALGLESGEVSELNAFLDKLADHRFNYIILNGYAHDTGWRKGKSEDADYGPPAEYAWAGTNQDPDHSRLNLDYWKHYDKVIEALHQRGIVAHIMLKVYNKQVNWPQPRSTEDDRYFKWMVARYAAYPNVVWDFSKEAHNDKDVDYKIDRLHLVRKHDPYDRLTTVHDDNAAYDQGRYDEVVDYRSDQQHSRWYETLTAQKQMRDWPVVNVEFGYEWGPGGKEDKTYGVVQSPEEVVRRAWEVSMARGGIVYYYTRTAWDVIDTEDTPTGYGYFRNLYDFFADTLYWRMAPADLTDKGWCLANPGREYIVFMNRAEPFTLRLEGLKEPLQAEWYHPWTGKRTADRQLESGAHRFTPPASFGDAPAVLHVAAPTPWVSLFNGTDLSGWAVKAKPEDKAKGFWKVDDGTILADSLGAKGHDYVWLYSDNEYGDFQLRLKFQIYRNTPGNTGIQIRSRYDDRAYWLHGPQIDIHPPGPWRTGMSWDETKGNQRWLFPNVAPGKWVNESMADPQLKVKYSDQGDGWNEMVVTALGTSLSTRINGNEIMNYNGAGVLNDEVHQQQNAGMKGHIALQIHRGDQVKVRFKDIQIREFAR